MRKVILILMLLLIPTFAWATDAEKVHIPGGYMWAMNGDAITATGNSYTMHGQPSCKTYTACFTTSSTTNMTAAFNVGWDTDNLDAVKTYTLSSDATHCYGWSFPTPVMYVTFTITTGQVDQLSFKVMCVE